MTHEYQPTDIAENELQLMHDEEAQAQAEAMDVEDLKWVMSNKRGRRFVHSLLERAGVYRLSFNANALSMAFAEGQRNEGLRLLAQLNEHCPARLAEMQKEQVNG